MKIKNIEFDENTLREVQYYKGTFTSCAEGVGEQTKWYITLYFDIPDDF